MAKLLFEVTKKIIKNFPGRCLVVIFIDFKQVFVCYGYC